MRYFGLLLMLIGIAYSIYVHKTRNQLNLYIREKIESIKKPEKYFEIQYLAGLINSVILLISGLIFFLIFDSYIISIFLLPVSALIFNLNNHIVVKLASNRGFIEKAS